MAESTGFLQGQQRRALCCGQGLQSERDALATGSFIVRAIPRSVLAALVRLGESGETDPVNQRSEARVVADWVEVWMSLEEL